MFLVLMAHRQTYPPSRDFVNALNLIDVVFGDDTKVTGLWHEYYDMLGSAAFATEYPKRVHKYLELLSEMGRVLGYKNLKQTDIDKFYSPVAHNSEADVSWRTQTELLRVLQGTQHLIIPHQLATEQPSASSPNGTVPEAQSPAPNQGTPAVPAGSRVGDA